jgi:hypothetical protein
MLEQPIPETISIIKFHMNHLKTNKGFVAKYVGIEIREEGMHKPYLCSEIGTEVPRKIL